MSKATLFAALLASSWMAQGEETTFRGVLMDASCAAIAGERTTAHEQRPKTGAANVDQGTGVTEEVKTGGVTGKSGPEAPALEEGKQVPPKTANKDTARNPGATSGGNSASALGTTGAAVTAPDTVPESGDTGERSRTVTTVRERYRSCVAKPTTTEFALHTEGKLYLFDEHGNNMIRQQMRNEAFSASMAGRKGAPEWISVTVTGNAGDRDVLRIRSVRK